MNNESETRLAGETLGIDLRAEAVPEPKPKPAPTGDEERAVVLCPCPRPGMYQRCFRFPCIYSKDSSVQPAF